MNRCCGIYRSLPLTSRDILLTILTERVRLRNDHCSSLKIITNSNAEIIIWLWMKLYRTGTMSDKY